MPRLAELADSTPLIPLGGPLTSGTIWADEDDKEEIMPEISIEEAEKEEPIQENKEEGLTSEETGI